MTDQTNPTREALHAVSAYMAAKHAPPLTTDASEFRFSFEELSLVSDNSFSAGLVNGSAQITYWRDDGYAEWTVGRIYLEGFRKATDQERVAGFPFYIRRDVEIEHIAGSSDFNSHLYLAVFGQLDGDPSWRKLIDDEVETRLEGEAA